MENVVSRYADYTGDDLEFELDFTSNTSIFDSDLVVNFTAVPIIGNQRIPQRKIFPDILFLVLHQLLDPPIAANDIISIQ